MRLYCILCGKNPDNKEEVRTGTRKNVLNGKEMVCGSVLYTAVKPKEIK